MINGRAETVALELFQKAEAGEELPKLVQAPEPTIEQLVIPHKRFYLRRLSR